MDSLLRSVLNRLGFTGRPEPTLESLRALYDVWCQKVPFDNLRKLIHVRSGDPGPLPGSAPEDFFEAWLRHGAGGTCWAGAGALHSLLTSLGFDACRGVATMLVRPDLPPNHGTVRVTIDGRHWLVDESILHGEPLLLDESAETFISHPAWGVRCYPRDGRLHILWRPLHKTGGMECRLERFGATADEYQERYEQTRVWSPFNYELYARTNRGDTVNGLAFGKAVSLFSDGKATEFRASHSTRQRILIEDIGHSPEIVSQLPQDSPTPPPPGSRTAQASQEI
jgi:N-hydroxyarylamine O-acetyltransferase